MKTTESKRPVFVVGSARSGTTLLYHMLLSAGGFAVYRAETHAFDLVGPSFGDLRRRRTREKLMDAWLKTHLFERSGLEADQIRARVLAECRTVGDFLRIHMESIAEKQGVDRWADCTPAHLLYMTSIKSLIPDAQFIHIIRDGRDVALSLAKTGWIKPLPWDSGRRLAIAALYWEWFVSRGRAAGLGLGDDYIEIHFEQLVTEPRVALASVGEFIHQDLDYEVIRQVGIGSVSKPNTSFPEDSRGSGPSSAVGRWKQRLSAEQVQYFDLLIGPCLSELGYELRSVDAPLRTPVALHALKRLYHAYFSTKHWVRSNTPLGRVLVDIHSLDR